MNTLFQHLIIARLVVISTLTLCTVADAQVGESAPPETAAQLVTVGVSAKEHVIVPGKTFHIAVRFDLAPQWHIYWKNAGATGAPTQITVKAPDGFTVGETIFPAPHRFTDDILGDSFGYAYQTVLFVPVTASREVSAESATFEVLVDYLVCKQRCLIGEANLNLVVPMDDVPSEKRIDPAIARHWNLIPEPLDAVDAASIRLSGGELVITLPGPIELDSIDFFPEYTPGVQYAPEIGAVSQGGEVHLSIPLEIKPGNALGKPLRVAGAITVGKGSDARTYAFSRPIVGENHDRLGPPG